MTTLEFPRERPDEPGTGNLDETCNSLGKKLHALDTGDREYVTQIFIETVDTFLDDPFHARRKLLPFESAIETPLAIGILGYGAAFLKACEQLLAKQRVSICMLKESLAKLCAELVRLGVD